MGPSPSRLALLVAAVTGALVLMAAGGGAAAPAATCTYRAKAFFWTGTADRMRLARALAAARSPCVEYWLSIPPLAADKKRLRVDEDDAIRALGIHPVAELTTGENTGWANWVNEPGANRTWFDAGVAFRRAMEDAGYDVSAGETWLINEFDRTTMRDAPRGPVDHEWPPARRADMRELMRGLYQGAPGMPPAPGIAEIGIHFRHQNIPNVPRYRADLKRWLLDAAFWRDADRYLRWIAVESYADSRMWAPPRSTLSARADHLEAYVFHDLELLRSAPREARVARSFFERKFLPLANGGWRARGGEQFDFVTGHGNTILDDVQMRQFVSEQVYAMRRYAGAHGRKAPAGRLGFSWQPCNRSAASEPECRPPDDAFRLSVDAVAARIAESVRGAYGEGRANARAACVYGRTDWCRGRVPGARFTGVWNDFRW
jgi:hypothetical protein